MGPFLSGFRNFYQGLRLIVYGFFMKLVVADRLAIYVDSIYRNSDKHSGPTLILATVFLLSRSIVTLQAIRQ